MLPAWLAVCLACAATPHTSPHGHSYRREEAALENPKDNVSPETDQSESFHPALTVWVERAQRLGKTLVPAAEENAGFVMGNGFSDADSVGGLPDRRNHIGNKPVLERDQIKMQRRGMPRLCTVELTER
jgi:hypothetical protein